MEDDEGEGVVVVKASVELDADVVGLVVDGFVKSPGPDTMDSASRNVGRYEEEDMLATPFNVVEED